MDLNKFCEGYKGLVLKTWKLASLMFATLFLGFVVIPLPLLQIKYKIETAPGTDLLIALGAVALSVLAGIPFALYAAQKYRKVRTVKLWSADLGGMALLFSKEFQLRTTRRTFDFLTKDYIIAIRGG